MPTRLVPLAAAALLIATIAASPTPSPPLAPPCTQIPVTLVGSLDSGTSRTGDVFRFRTIDTIVADKTTVPRSAIGYGLVTYASSAGAHGKAGDLVVEARYIVLGAGRSYQVTIDSVATAASVTGSTGNAPGGAAAMPIPFAGTAVSAFNYLHSGKNAHIPAGTRFVVTPVADLAHKHACTL